MAPLRGAYYSSIRVGLGVAEREQVMFNDDEKISPSGQKSSIPTAKPIVFRQLHTKKVYNNVLNHVSHLCNCRFDSVGNVVIHNITIHTKDNFIVENDSTI